MVASELKKLGVFGLVLIGLWLFKIYSQENHKNLSVFGLLTLHTNKIWTNNHIAPNFFKKFSPSI